MDDKTWISESLKKLNQKIDNQEFQAAFLILKNIIAKYKFYHLLSHLSRIEDTYRYMAHYLVEGYEDNSRKETLEKIQWDLRKCVNKIVRETNLIDNPDLYSSTKRFLKIRNADIKDLLEKFKQQQEEIDLLSDNIDVEKLKRNEETTEEIFNYIWTMSDADNDEYFLLEMFWNQIDDSIIKAQIISAIMLANLRYIDAKGLKFIIDVYISENNEDNLRARALVALTMILINIQINELKNPEVYEILNYLETFPSFANDIKKVFLEIIRCFDTERIMSKMQNVVLPYLMKIQPDVLNKFRDNLRNKSLNDEDINPEWEEFLEKSGVGDKLKELTEMQMEGGDVMMLAFSNLKNFPFFNSVSNWFLPFSSRISPLFNLKESDSKIFEELLSTNGMICDSDKYSFALSLQSLPEIQKKMIADNLKQQAEQINEILALNNSSLESEFRTFIRDIYRFFKLFRKKGDFIDPFVNPQHFLSLPIFEDILNDEEFLGLSAEFFFRHGYYKEALDIFERLNSSSPADPHLWEKIGYCHNMLKNIEEASLWYKKAELFNPESLWLLKRLASTSRLLHQYEDASEYYERILSHEPENINILIGAGKSLMNLGKYSDALSKFHHAFYLDPSNYDILRAIAWSELLSGDSEKSLATYNKILNSDMVTDEDYLNLGHVYLKKKDYKSAIENYKHFLSLSGNDPENLEKAIKEDMESMLKTGIDPIEIRLVVDKIRYDLSD